MTWNLWERYGSEFVDVLNNSPLKELVAEAGVEACSMSRLVRTGVLAYTINPLERRLKLVSVNDLDRLGEQSLISEECD